MIAWSAGAMALTERVVLFHDYGPEGDTEAEVFDRGLGRVQGIVALPHARRRLRLDDRDRCAVMARRFTDQHCVLLDDGTALELTADGGLPLRRADPRHRRRDPRAERAGAVERRGAT